MIAVISNFSDVGNVSTLANPEVVDDIRHRIQHSKLDHGDVPRQLKRQEPEEIEFFGDTE
ncbi:hypothetical protein [Amycolatopsis sp. DSM 110486]|uniref:hypothetical protein n=1 Tax=Amycolatopsis sp. DSM 110486 TaxID=2865832 RepID=UPI001C6A0604|nr:hypothetical protein [Amycolatopsis sp. DSM 110486]QYN19263.1 hypothetical protein K1T34_42630 [Amycolatopsis sp. DSM 110486]